MSIGMYKDARLARIVRRLREPDVAREINVAASLVTGLLMTLVAAAAAKLSFALFAVIWIIVAVMVAYFWVGRDPGTWFGFGAVQAALKDEPSLRHQ